MRACLVVLLLMVCGVAANAQREISDTSPLSERLYFGGGLGLNGGTDTYGNRYFYVGLFPIVGYMVNNNLSVGTGISYQYYSYPDVDVTLNQYGVSPFIRYNFGQIFAYAEYMLLNSPTFINSQRTMFDRLLLGIGYAQPIGGRASLNVIGMYDVIWRQSDYAFASPWVFRVYFSF